VLAAAGARVLEVELAVGHARERFDADGRLSDESLREELVEVLEALQAGVSRPAAAEAA
jgi:chromate reductase, NAD(P)H dehydrogenase (quinone)